MRRPEEALHRTVARFLDLALPEGTAWTSLEPGGYRTKAEAGIAKARGVKAGWPDVLIVFKGRAIFFELKGPKGRLSAAQKAAHVRLNLAGAVVYTVQSLDELAAFLGQLIPLRARVA